MRTHLTLLTLTLTASLAAAQSTAPSAMPAPSPASPAAQTASPAKPATPGAIVDVPAGHWARAGVTLLIQKGLILGYPDGTFRGNQAITRYEAAAIFARLLSQGVFQLPGVQAQLTPADLDVLARAITELAAQIVTINTRLTDVVTDVDDVKARLGVVEGTLQQVVGVAATKSDVDAVAAQAATKTDLAAVQAGAASAEQVQALEARVAALEAEKAALQAKAAQDQAAAAVSAKAAEPKPGDLPNVTFRPDAPANAYVGGGVQKSLVDGVGYSAVLGLQQVAGGFGVQAAADFNSSARLYSAQANVTRPFGGADALFQPYVGLGGGVLVSPDRQSGASAADGFVSALGGVNYAFTDTLKVFVELDGRYYLSRKGAGTGLADGSAGGLGGGVRLGAKLTF
ncbi:S-layer homology domain-containing protein [Deinococcus radiotolerans]|uniref:SLH domain-containing protein n=1 Tax=Deinococcus radiotolerans TaxID=1309407 RepID=A0ABQ2FP39_9DEIO|nr:S-layer homology domain-containing protein [Deinococcus radiotolerans]GGL13022.1 hypothetical protein GCM10010844_34740 [Deinococcus radiotolerans]